MNSTSRAKRFDKNAMWHPARKRTKALLALVAIWSCAGARDVLSGDSQALSQATVVIIAPEEFDRIAQELSNLYRVVLPKGSVNVVHTEWIREHISPVSADKLPEGYETHHPIQRVPEWNPQTKEGYDYLLAKKIIAYLQGLQGGGSLRYVTLMGGCEHVPPSYYARCKGGAVYRFDMKDEYAFCPTDFLYCSPDLDIEADFAVGRLPFRSAEQGLRFIEKLKAWSQACCQGDWFHTAAALSGNVCDTRFEPHLGEISTLYSFLKPNARWTKIVRYFDSRGRTFTASNVRVILNEGNVGWAYHVNHGHGNYIAGSRDDVGTSEIMKYRQIENRLPIWLTVACEAGDYDSRWLPEKDYEYSVGEAVLLSRAGAIGFLGGAGYTAGESRSEIDKSGNVMVRDVDYLMQILDGVLRAYYSSPQAPLLGDMVKSSLRNYVSWLSEDELKDPAGTTMLYSFVFLGDPLLKLPAPSKSGGTYDVPRVITEFDEFREKALARGGYKEKYTIPYSNLNAGSSELSLQIARTSAKKLRVLLLDQTDNLLDDQTLQRRGIEAFSYVFKPTTWMSGPYQLIMIALAGQNGGAPTERGEGRCWLWLEYSPSYFSRP